MGDITIYLRGDSSIVFQTSCSNTQNTGDDFHYKLVKYYLFFLLINMIPSVANTVYINKYI